MESLGDKGLGGALGDGKTLFSFLGQFWHGVYEDPDFAERFCEAAGLLSAQLEQKKAEAKSASGRKELPVYSRERWLCVKLVPENRNKTPVARVRVSASAPAIGPQPAGRGYIQGAVPVIGQGQQVSGDVLYALPKYVVSAESLHERVFDPEVTLEAGTDFTVSDGAISFPFLKDPVSDPRFRKSPDGDGTIVWLKDALVDKNFVSDYVGYVVGMRLVSSQRNLDTVNAFWDLINTGATISGLSKFVCKALGVPCIEETVETVESVSRSASGYLVKTDKHEYASKFEPFVSRGQVLSCGAPLTQAVRIIESADRAGDGVLFLKQGFFADNLVSGLGFSSDPVDVTFHGWGADGQYPHLRFGVYGNPDDADAFFNACWKRCEESGTDLASILGITMPYEPVAGAVVGQIVPSRFLLDNLIGTNVVFVRIDLSLLDEEGLASAGLLSRTFEVAPPGVCLVFCLSPGEISEQYRCQVSDGDANFAAAVSTAEETVSEAFETVRHFLLPAEEKNNP